MNYDRCPHCNEAALVRVLLGQVCASCGWNKELLNKVKRVRNTQRKKAAK